MLLYLLVFINTYIFNQAKNWVYHAYMMLRYLLVASLLSKPELIALNQAIVGLIQDAVNTEIF